MDRESQLHEFQIELDVFVPRKPNDVSTAGLLIALRTMETVHKTRTRLIRLNSTTEGKYNCGMRVAK